MAAYKDGKEIQCKHNASQSSLWCDTPKPCWDWNVYDYRVKTEPKYRPYKNAEEFIKAQKDHGPYVKTTGFPSLGSYTIPYTVSNNKVFWKAGYDLYSSWEELSNCYWEDGTPCGVLEG